MIIHDYFGGSNISEVYIDKNKITIYTNDGERYVYKIVDNTIYESEESIIQFTRVKKKMPIEIDYCPHCKKDVEVFYSDHGEFKYCKECKGIITDACSDCGREW